MRTYDNQVLRELELLQEVGHQLLRKEDSVALLTKALVGLLDSMVMTLKLTISNDYWATLEGTDNGGMT